jgi:hypothetical protein
MLIEFVIDFVKIMLALSSLALSNCCESCSELFGNTQNYIELFRVELNQDYFISCEHWLLELASETESHLVVHSSFIYFHRSIHKDEENCHTQKKKTVQMYI